MMKTFIKSLILIIAIIFAIGAVLFFIRTIVTPPEDIVSENSHEADIEQSVINYSPDSLSLVDAEMKLDSLCDRATLFLSDSLISAMVCDDAIAKITNRFVDAFSHWAYGKFGANMWYDKDHEEMRRIISKVKGISIEQGTKSAIDDQTLLKLNGIDKIIVDYNDAWEASRHTAFLSLVDAKNKIAASNKFKNHVYLKNCDALRNALGQVPIKLEQSHYNHLINSVSSLSYYRNMAKSEYIRKSQDVNSVLKEYEENAKKEYGTKRDISSLRSRAGDYYNEAMDYYRLLEGVTKYNPSYSTTNDNRGCKITKVEMNLNQTKVSFTYYNSYSSAGWVTIEPRTYILDQKGNRCYLVRAEGIPMSPHKHYFRNSNESLSFTLIFDKLPLGTTSFNLIESESSSWKFYNINVN